MGTGRRRCEHIDHRHIALGEIVSASDQPAASGAGRGKRIVIIGRGAGHDAGMPVVAADPTPDVEILRSSGIEFSRKYWIRSGRRDAKRAGFGGDGDHLEVGRICGDGELLLLRCEHPC